MVEAGGVGIFRALKTRKLLILLDAQNSRNAEIAPNWNVSGTRAEFRSPFPKSPTIADQFGWLSLFCLLRWCASHRANPELSNGRLCSQRRGTKPRACFTEVCRTTNHALSAMLFAALDLRYGGGTRKVWSFFAVRRRPLPQLTFHQSHYLICVYNA